MLAHHVDEVDGEGFAIEKVSPAEPEQIWRAAAPRLAEYRSSFAKWDRRASVRVKPQRKLADDDSIDLYFPPELVPAAAHPLVVARGPEMVREFLVTRLYHYLNFTTELEEVAVIPVTLRISRGNSGMQVPGEMRRDAFKITTDEAWHAQFSFDFLEQVERHTGVELRLPPPEFVQRLAQVRAGLDTELRGMEELVFAVVSETLISAILADIPRDRRLPCAVRELVADHAEDEGRHHAYFRSVLQIFWSALSPRERRQLGPHLPKLIYAFLEPDYRSIGFGLLDVGLSQEEVAQVLAEAYPADRLRASVTADSQATVRYFTEVGALEDPATRAAFQEAGLVSGN